MIIMAAAASTVYSTLHNNRTFKLTECILMHDLYTIISYATHQFTHGQLPCCFFFANFSLISLFLSHFLSFTAVRFGRVPKREKARILAAMQQSTQNRGHQRAMATELDDQPRLLAAVLRAHMDTCEFTRDKVTSMRQRARDCPSYSMPTMVSRIYPKIHFIPGADYYIFQLMRYCVQFDKLCVSVYVR